VAEHPDRHVQLCRVFGGSDRGHHVKQFAIGPRLLGEKGCENLLGHGCVLGEKLVGTTQFIRPDSEEVSDIRIKEIADSVCAIGLV
jgi:hypothetical protein